MLSVPRFPYANVLSQSEKWRATESGYYVYRRMNLQILINLNGEVIVSCSDTIVAISNIDIVVQDLLQTPATTVQILTNNRLLRIGSFYLYKRSFDKLLPGCFSPKNEDNLGNLHILSRSINVGF